MPVPFLHRHECLPAESFCDYSVDMQGATASHPTDGDLSLHIDACKPGFRFSVYGLAACGIDTSVVGNHTVSFFLSDASLSVVSTVVTRVVVVPPVCAAEERLCSDGSTLSCSTSGICPHGTPANAQLENSAPSLRFRSGQQGTVYVPGARSTVPAIGECCTGHV